MKKKQLIGIVCIIAGIVLMYFIFNYEKKGHQFIEKEGVLTKCIIIRSNNGAINYARPSVDFIFITELQDTIKTGMTGISLNNSIGQCFYLKYMKDDPRKAVVLYKNKCFPNDTLIGLFRKWKESQNSDK